MQNMYQYEIQLYNEGYQTIAGVDEVGRGPMAGPLVATAVVLPKHCIIDGVNDSKLLSEKKREALYEEIMQKAIAVYTHFIDVDDVDVKNVYRASKEAMLICVEKCANVDFVLSDAMLLDTRIPQMALIKGDQKSASIAAASIIAKVERDRYMCQMDALYPEYGFAQHKGYVTKKHLEALMQFGVTPIHRKSFAPVKQYLLNQKK